MHFCIQRFIFCLCPEFRIWQALANQSCEFLQIFPKSVSWYHSIYKIFKVATVGLTILPLPSTKKTIWQRKLKRKQEKHTMYLFNTCIILNPHHNLIRRNQHNKTFFNQTVTLEESRKAKKGACSIKKYKSPAGRGDW